MTKKILFVCEGNSIRSIMAEAAFNKFCHKKGWKAISAGTRPTNRIDDNTKQALKEVKIPLKKKAPSLFTFEIAVDAKKIIKMDEHIPNFPALVPEEQLITWSIGDVVGRPIDRFRQARDQIIVNVKELIKRLK